MKRMMMAVFGLALAVISVSGQGANLSLAWDPSPSEAAYPDLQYKLYTDGSTNGVLVGRVNGVTLSNLVAGKSYSFYVTAVATSPTNSAVTLESPASNTLLWTPSAGIPPAPELIAVSARSLSATQWQISLSWKPIDPGYVVTNYMVVIKQGATFRTNGFGTNLSASINVPAFSPTVPYLGAENYLGPSSLVPTTSITQLGQSRNLRVIVP